MEFNLKNRPRLAEGECAFRVSDYCRSYVDQWFAGFEKQLREMIAEIPEGYSRPYVPLTTEALIKEILGDQP